jgi:hypothetical protein
MLKNHKGDIVANPQYLLILNENELDTRPEVIIGAYNKAVWLIAKDPAQETTEHKP